MLSAIIVAAGSSHRMGFDKLFAMLGDKPVVAHTLDAFERTESVTKIILVGRKDRLRELNEVVQAQNFKKVREIVAGGEHRQDSVRAGLEKLDPDAEFVAVHDAARPLITPEQIERVFKLCRAHHAAALGEPVNDTLKRATGDYFICGSVDRKGLYALQTPQIFLRRLLTEAYDSVALEKLSVTDETSAVEHLGEKVVIVPSEDFNFKITYPGDLPLAEFILSQRQRAR
jgi:2-C-methyl-D-erythritol 4-phosphate cytidylyltransferase